MHRCLALLAALALVPHAAEAGGPAELRLLPGWREAGGAHVAGVEIAMPQGWHTYWRVPGTAGIPPTFDWSGSSNLARARVEWPRPDVFESFGLRTIGYHDHVVLPLVLTPEDPARPIELRVSMSFGVCKDVCIPAHGDLAGRLGVEAATAEARAPIEAALATRARRPSEAGILEATCGLANGERGLALAATVRMRHDPGRPQVAVIEAETRPDLWIGEASARTAGTVVTASAPVEGTGAAVIVNRSDLRVTLIDPERFVEIEGCRAPDPMTADR